MFHWRKKMDRLDVPTANIRRLHRSLSDIQVALPGLPSQQATAYLCLFVVKDGFGISIVFHLHASRLLAFYVPDREKIPKQEAGRVLDEGIHFAESMGFIMGDLDIQLLGPEEQDSLWNSLPLKRGVAAGAIPEKQVQADQPEKAPAVVPEQAEVVEQAEEIGELEKDLEVRRAAVLRRRKPSPEEIEVRRKTLLKNLGRFLASF